MEYQKLINLLGTKTTQSVKRRLRNWVEINDDAHGTYKTNAYIKYKTTMLDTSLCNYSDAYIIVKRNFIVMSGSLGIASMQADKRNKQAIFKNYTLLTDSIKEINNRQVIMQRTLM